MENSIVKKIDIKRFNVLMSLTRNKPMLNFFAQELEYFSNIEETILGIICLDKVDSDYTAIVLARDEGNRFRAIELKASIKTISEAKNWLICQIVLNTNKGIEKYPQGDEENKGVDLFSPIVIDEKQHPYFKHLNSNPSYLPAKRVINETMNHFIDIDGNFVQQFQSTGFDSRLWELYLNLYLDEEEFSIIRDFARPDFIIEKYEEKIAIEALIVGRSQDNPPDPEYSKVIEKMNSEEFLNKINNEIPIKIANSLEKKMRKRYWELEHVKFNPLIFAIADFHDDHSMIYTSTAIIRYLYGIEHKYHYENDKLVIEPLPVKIHKAGNKSKVSGFFFLPDSKFVSAILFSSSGTISKFNRLGKQAGFGDVSIKMIRHGTCYDKDPNASAPKIFCYEVNENCNETWSEGLEMFHNPNALYPVPKELFPSIAHNYYKDGQIISFIPPFHPYSSITMSFSKKE